MLACFTHNKVMDHKADEVLETAAPTTRESGQADESVHLSITRPDDLVSLIPYWLGYQPDSQVVVLAVHEGVVELGCSLTHEQLADEELVRGVTEMLHCRVVEPRFLVVGYGEPLSCDEAVARMEIALDPALVTISAVVSGDRYWLRSDGETPGCTPGNRFDPSASVATSTAITAGLQVLGGRDEITAMVAGPGQTTPGSSNEWAKTTDDVATWSRQARMHFLDEHLARVLDSPQLPKADEIVQLAAVVQDMELRDQAWLAMDAARAWRYERLWLHAVSATPDEGAPAVLCLAAVASWLGGGGAVFTECLTRCERLAPSYSMGVLLREIHDHAVPPSLWKRMGETQAMRHQRCGTLAHHAATDTAIDS